MNVESKFLIGFLAVMVLCGIFGFRQCSFDRAQLENRHQSYRTCLMSGKYTPLECQKSSEVRP